MIAGDARPDRRAAARRVGSRTCTRRSCARSTPRACTPATRRSCIRTARSTGFVGGTAPRSRCALHAAQRARDGRAAAAARSSRRPRQEEPPEGVVVAHNPCLSGGAFEVFLEPRLPAPRLVVVGEAPVARALAELGRAAGLRGRRPAPSRQPGDAAVVVASHGAGRGGRARRGAARRACRTSRSWRAAGAARRCGPRSTCPTSCARASTSRPGSTSAPGRRVEIAPVSILAAAHRRARARRRPGGCRGEPRRRRTASAARCRMHGPQLTAVRHGLVLAAGGSRRLGRPKQLLPYGDATLLDHVARHRASVRFDQLICVLGGARRGRAGTVDLRGADVVVNRSSATAAPPRSRPRWARSTRAATSSSCCSATSPASGRRPSRRCSPAAATRRSRSAATTTAAATRSRSRAHVRRARALHGDKARVEAARPAPSVVEVAVPGPVPRDVDTWEDYEAVLAERA